MNNYKIKRNPKPLSDEQINRHKDFSKLLNNHQKLHHYKDATRPLYKKIGFMSLVILIGVVILMLVIDNNEVTKSKVKDSISVEKSGSKAVRIDTLSEENSIINVETTKSTTTNKGLISTEQMTKSIAYEIFKITPEKGAVLYTLSGARILIPNFAFFDEKGNVTKKEITLYYRECLSLEEAGFLKKEINFTPTLLFEIKAEESNTKAPVSLTQAIEVEATTPIKDSPETVYNYSSSKEKWESVGKEKISYRFSIQFNESEFPELATLNGLLWELPEQVGKPSDFGYIFNRPWKNFSFIHSNKKELVLKNTNTSYKSVSDLGVLLGTKKEDLKLITAFTTLFKTVSEKNLSENKLNAKLVVDNWKNSLEGKAYSIWLKSKATEDQYFSDRKTSKITIKALGFSSLNTISSNKNSTTAYKRVLVLQKYPEKDQHFSKEEIQREPSLKR